MSQTDPHHSSLQSQPEASHRYSRRHYRALMLIGTFMAAAGAGWALFFLWRDLWHHAASQILLLLFGCWAVERARHNDLHRATLIVVIGLFFVLTVIVLFFDLPSPKAPRAVHHFYLAMGVGTFLLLKRESVWLQHLVSLLCFAAF